MGYSEAEKVEIFSLYVKNNKNKCAARREYRTLYPNRAIPSVNTFLNVYRHVNRTHSFSRKRRRNVTANEEEDLDILLYFEGKKIIYYKNRSIPYFNICFRKFG